jgi:hypothetical protein
LEFEEVQNEFAQGYRADEASNFWGGVAAKAI